MKKALIRGLIFAFSGVLLFTASTHVPTINNIITNYALIIVIAGVGLFIYASKLPMGTQQIGYTVGGIIIFRGLVSVSYVTNLIAQYPLIVIAAVFGLFYFHDKVFSITKLHNH